MNLFQRISDWLVESKNEWCKPIKAHALAAAILTLRPKVVVEIGIFRGGSFIPMAMALKETGSGIAIGIDPWNAKASIEGQTGEDLAWWANVDHEAIYREFLGYVNHIGLYDVVQIERKRSDEFQPHGVIDLLHIDGNHGPQSIRDVERYASHIRIGGLCFMDDIGWRGGSVAAAALRLMEMGFVKLYDMDTGAMFQRIR